MTLTLKNLPKLSRAPGVYLMKDEAGEVIYVGKANNLSNRVRSYFQGRDERHNVPYLLKHVSRVETLITADERQAIILEADLIRKYKPRYNVRLKDDRAHLLVRIDVKHEWPRIETVRKKRDDGARYFGPFAFGYELRALLEIIYRSIPLRTCSDRVFGNRVRPCLEYQIKRCAGPCCLAVEREDYDQWVKQAIDILQGKSKKVEEQLEAKMERASKALSFEEAGAIRDRLQAFRQIREQRIVSELPVGAVDAFGFYREYARAEVSVLIVRDGRMQEAKNYSFENLNIPDDEFVGAVLSQFYGVGSGAGADFPDEMLLAEELEDGEVRGAYYSERRGKKVLISVPQRGTKERLLRVAEANARENFSSRRGKDVGNSDEACFELQRVLGLEQVPRIIECMDVSHFQGASTVGAIVCFKDGEPHKPRYRSFRLSQEGKPDDFASIAEIARRHLSRLLAENELPDLLVVDGGAAQLGMAVRERKALGVREPAMIGLAKKRVRKSSYLFSAHLERKPERVYIEGQKEPIILPADSAANLLLERIRDEAHRRAITFHRSSRSKSQ